MSKADQNREAYQRKLARAAGASDAKSGAKLTANVAKAGSIRCPVSGKKFDRTTPGFKKWRDNFATG